MKRVFSVSLFLIFLIVSTDFCFAGISVVGGLTQEKIANPGPGDKFERTILLKNTEKKPLGVKIYKTDYLFYSDGTTLYGEPGGVPRSNASWITISPNRLTIHPGETVPVHYAVRVPDDPDLKGTYWGMVMVEPLAEAASEENGKFGIQTVVRYGIQVVTHIGNSGTRQIKFSDKKLIVADGKRKLQIDMENIGERGLSPSVWTELYDQQGKLVGRFESSQLRIYPGCSVRHHVNLTDVPEGRYKALVVADNGDEYIFGAQYNLEIE